jgi:uncharacterized lipoprotein YddW (UPF0748 family)
MAAGVSAALGAAPYEPSTVKPPAPAREFRGAWVATVGNIDWPSRPGLTTQAQQAELIAILDCAARLRLNAIVLQVRPACDAFYASRLEPWSEYLTGRMGQAPEPFYDPLAFAVEQAHKRGLELHAWVNPYRVRTAAARSPAAATHVSKAHPAWVKTYGRQLWLDPGEAGVPDYILEVVLDIARRYDVDGVAMDDYFYPYQIRDSARNVIPFPDEASWKRYRASGGKLERDDWRRQNVDRLVERLYRTLKAEKPGVKLIVSPSGIWRPGHPPQIRGHDTYAQIYADTRKWLVNGWLDAFAPQLYWDIDAREQSYPVLLKWWVEQNAKQRHLWPAIAVSRVGPGRRGTDEILRQIRLTRDQAGANGNILWNFKPLLEDRSSLATVLGREVYAQPALTPRTAWLDDTIPARPELNARLEPGPTGVQLTWQAPGTEPARLWVLQTRAGGVWQTRVLPPGQTSLRLNSGSVPDCIALSALDACGNLSPPAVVQRQNGGGTSGERKPARASAPRLVKGGGAFRAPGR